MNKNLYVVMIASLMIAYSAFGVAQSQDGTDGGQQQGEHRNHRRPQMDATTQAAFDACITENNLVKPQRGQKPSDEDRAKMDACLNSKGVSMPAPPSEPPAGQFGPPPQFEDHSY